MIVSAEMLVKTRLQLLSNVDVTVFVPSMIAVGEANGSVQVCTTLLAMEDTGRDFTITLTTYNGTSIYIIWYYHCIYYYYDCRYRWL